MKYPFSIFQIIWTLQILPYKFGESLILIPKQFFILRKSDISEAMSSYIESVLQRLLIPDSAIIKQATKQLLDYFVSEKCVLGLYEVLKTSKDKQVLEIKF